MRNLWNKHSCIATIWIAPDVESIHSYFWNLHLGISLNKYSVENTGLHKYRTVLHIYLVVEVVVNTEVPTLLFLPQSRTSSCGALTQCQGSNCRVTLLLWGASTHSGCDTHGDCCCSHKLPRYDSPACNAHTSFIRVLRRESQTSITLLTHSWLQYTENFTLVWALGYTKQCRASRPCSTFLDSNHRSNLQETHFGRGAIPLFIPGVNNRALTQIRTYDLNKRYISTSEFLDHVLIRLLDWQTVCKQSANL